jgi:alcohol dehydrogenase
MSDFGIQREDIPKLIQNARDTMGGLFDLDRYQLSDEDVEKILDSAYK